MVVSNAGTATVSAPGTACGLAFDVVTRVVPSVIPLGPFANGSLRWRRRGWGGINVPPVGWHRCRCRQNTRRAVVSRVTVVLKDIELRAISEVVHVFVKRRVIRALEKVVALRLKPVKWLLWTLRAI